MQKNGLLECVLTKIKVFIFRRKSLRGVTLSLLSFQVKTSYLRSSIQPYLMLLLMVTCLLLSISLMAVRELKIIRRSVILFCSWICYSIDQSINQDLDRVHKAAIHYAAEKSRDHIIKFLLGRFVNISVVSTWILFILTLKMPIIRKCPVDLPTGEGTTALMFACKMVTMDLFKFSFTHL